MESNSVWCEFKAGSRVAYERVIRTHYQELYRYGLRLVNNPDFVKDCIHDLFVHIWDRRGHLTETDDVSRYLLRSLRNRILKELSRQARWVELEDNTDETYMKTSSIEEELVWSDDAALQEKKLGRFLKELSSRQREVIHLRFFQGLSNEHIAEIMDISKPAVANLLHITLKTLRSVWQNSRFFLAWLIFC